MGPGAHPRPLTDGLHLRLQRKPAFCLGPQPGRLTGLLVWLWTPGSSHGPGPGPLALARALGPGLAPGLLELALTLVPSLGHASHLCLQSGVNAIVGFHDVEVGPTSFMYTALSGFEQSLRIG